MRSADDVEAVRILFQIGLGDREISRRTGIPRSTIAYWRRTRIFNRPSPCLDLRWRPSDQRAYSYVLGLYLGDGYVAVGQSSASLTLVLDDCYPRIIEAARVALLSVFAGREVKVAAKRGEAATVLRVNGPEPAAAFPHHGDGKKHQRPIVLAPWQREITRRHPEALIRGLIHSDGSRVMNRFSTRLPSGRVAEYAYPRYFFTNYSEDIREIFREHCELLGIRCTQSSFKNMSVSHRDSVALLDAFVGPKS